MGDRLTDAAVVEFLRTERNFPTARAAATALGLTGNQAKTMHAVAAQRGLTADTPVVDEKEKLRIALRRAEADIKALATERDTAESIRREIYGLASRTPEPPTWLTKVGTIGKRGTPITMWSDWHYGEVVRPEEVGGVNEFNTAIAATRINTLVETIIDLCFNHMGKADTKYPGIVVCLGGDMISGDIHEELLATNERTPQQCINELTDLLVAALERMADAFGRVFVPCVVGNHGRATHKPRAKGRVYTSHEWNIYCNLERYFRKDKRVQFFIPDQSDAAFTVYDHRFLLTHGDSLGVKGGDGIIGSLGPIMRGRIKTFNSEAQIGREFDTLIIGHWHQYITVPGLIVNNCLKGFDEYARLFLRAPYSRPSQALWFVHPKHGLTTHWQVFLEDKRDHGHQAAEWLQWKE